MPRGRILVLCTGNSCRSQMAEGLLRSLDSELEVYSAGTQPAAAVHPEAIAAMHEIGIDISGSRPKHVDEFRDQGFDWVITVCGEAKETCPRFNGPVRHTIHIGFDDPATAKGSKEEVAAVFRRVRDEIRQRLGRFYDEHLRGKSAS